MPAPGHQHRTNGVATINPFDDQRPHISEYTAQEIATLQARLNKRLGPEYISTRAGPGNSKVAYLSAEKAINLANEVFGFNGWSSSIQNIQIDFVDENPQKGTVSIGLSVVVRVTLRDGTYHEDTGYGGIENCKSKIAAFEKAKKEGTTDALKRALRNFGNVLGNCIYDKDYITKIAKVNKGPGKWDVNDLHRHQDFAPKKEDLPQPKAMNSIPQSKSGISQLHPEDSFDANEFEEADFDELGNPDEMLLPADPEPVRPPHQPLPRQQLPQHTTPAKPTQLRPNQGPIVPPQGPIPPRQNQPQQAPVLPGPGPSHNPAHLDNGIASRSSSPGVPSQHFAAPPNMPGGGFYSARAAGSLDDNNNPVGASAAPAFNLYAESPSIRKTSGVDHTKSLALNRHTLKPEPLPQKDPIELKHDQPRKPGVPSPVPGAIPSPGARGLSTSAYRPPTRHGSMQAPSANGPAAVPHDKMPTAVKRAPLTDLSNVPGPQSLQDDSENKKPRIGPAGPAGGTVGGNENMR